MKFFIETYGCQMNVSDSELVTSILIEAGFSPTADINAADVIIFNTCSVRKHAEDRVLGRISNELSRKQHKPDLKIGVIGCMAQRIGGKLLAGKGIDFVAGVDQYINLPSLLSDNGAKQFLEMDDKQIYTHIQPMHETKYCGFVTIMRGCNNFCTYCIVPYVRGKERSRPLDDIIADVKNAGNNGIKDITLLGQNVNSYNDNNVNFPQLLAQINKLEEIDRIRFVTSHPKDLSDDLIEVMAASPKICEHIHLPMQSGDNEILHRMNRKYSIEHYMGLVDKLRKAMPDIAITTDIIAGFPGETDTQFNNTYRVMDEIGFDYAFCFKYSNRDGTAAADFAEQVPESIRLSRLQSLIDLQRQKTFKRFQKQVGKTVEVYVEGKSKHGGDQFSGKTRDFKICAFTGTEDMIGKLIKVRVQKATAGTLIGATE